MLSRGKPGIPPTTNGIRVEDRGAVRLAYPEEQGPMLE